MIKSIKKSAVLAFFISLLFFTCKTSQISAVNLNITKSYEIRTVLLDNEPSLDTEEIQISDTALSIESLADQENVSEEKTTWLNQFNHWWTEKIVDPVQASFEKVLTNIKNSRTAAFFKKQSEHIQKSIADFKAKRAVKKIKVKDVASFEEFDQLIPNHPDVRREKKMSYLNQKYQIKVKDGNKKWSEQELQWLSETLEIVPKEFYAKKSLSYFNLLMDKKLKIYRYDANEAGDTQTCAVSLSKISWHYIKVFDVASDCTGGRELPKEYKETGQPQNHPRYTEASLKIAYIHELAHIYVYNGHTNLEKEFSKFSWEEKKQTVKDRIEIHGTQDKTKEIKAFIQKKDAEKFVSKYAGGKLYYREIKKGVTLKHNYSAQVGLPKEDFAESIASYNLFPSTLKEISIKKYDFIKDKIYNGKEFEDVK